MEERQNHLIERRRKETEKMENETNETERDSTYMALLPAVQSVVTPHTSCDVSCK